MEKCLTLEQKWLGFTSCMFKDGAYLYRSIFAWFMSMREKEILARAIGIQKENWG